MKKLGNLIALARCVHELAGRHTEFYVDSKDLPDLEGQLAALQRISVDHLVMTPEGYPALLRFVELNAKVKGTAFDRVSEGLDVAQTLRHRFAYAMAKWVPLHCLTQIMGHDSLNTRIVYVLGTQGIDNGQSRSERGCEEALSGHVAWERRKVTYV